MYEILAMSDLLINGRVWLMTFVFVSPAMVCVLVHIVLLYFLYSTMCHTCSQHVLKQTVSPFCTNGLQVIKYSTQSVLER